MAVTAAEGLDVSGFEGDFDWEAAVKAAPGLAFGAYRLTSGLSTAAGASWNATQIRDHGLYSAAFHRLDPALSGALQAQYFVTAHAKLGLADTDMLWLDTETAGGSAAGTAACAVSFMQELDRVAASNPRGVFSFTDFMKYGYCAGLGGWPLWQAFPSAKSRMEPIPWMNWAIWSWGKRDGSDVSVYNGSVTQMAAWMASFSAPAAEAAAPAESRAKAIVISNAQLLQQLQILNKKADVIMSQQDEINADVQTIEAGVAALGTAEAAIQAELASLQAANPALDLSGLSAAAASLTTAVAGVTALAPAPAAPAATPEAPASS
jgi:GH25 family lysozyme M1 (1,4-beta-N-acetylmuramidase)